MCSALELNKNPRRVIIAAEALTTQADTTQLINQLTKKANILENETVYALLHYQQHKSNMKQKKTLS